MGDKLLLDPALAPALAAARLASVDALLALGGAPEATSLVTTVDREVPGTCGRFHLKCYRYPDWRRSRHLLGRGTVWGRAPEIREFENLAWLREHEVPAVRPVAAAARRRRGRLVAHALLTEHVPRAVDLAARLATPGDPVREEAHIRRRALAAIGRHLARMHAEGFVHGDAYARNILVRLDEEDVRVWFIDCRRGGARLGSSAARDLATLDADLAGRVSATDRLRGLRAWLAEDDDPRPLLGKIETLRARVQRRDEARARRRAARVSDLGQAQD